MFFPLKEAVGGSKNTSFTIWLTQTIFMFKWTPAYPEKHWGSGYLLFHFAKTESLCSV